MQRHELTEGLTVALTPHSRYNDLNEQELVASGYSILTRSSAAGVDAFVKEGVALEVFWQGHPEYEADTLARELRRDLQRFVGDATRVPPPLPENYLTSEAYAQLKAYIADVGRGAILSGEMLTLASLSESAFWARSSHRLMGAFLTAAFRRKVAAETLFADV